MAVRCVHCQALAKRRTDQHGSYWACRYDDCPGTGVEDDERYDDYQDEDED